LFTTRHQDLDDISLAPEGEEQEDYFTPTTSGESIQFWPWVNKVKINNYRCRDVGTDIGWMTKTPMTASPELPLEIVMQIFKRLG